MTTRKKILVVDDDEAVTTYLKAKIATEYDVVTTNVSTRALALARSEHPDLVICDVDMPQLDGGDLAAKLASDPTTRDIQLLFLTGLLSPEEAESVGGEVSGRPAISKRAPLPELLGRIKELIG
jgi:two-component system sensor histidine kinase/response regulator